MLKSLKVQIRCGYCWIYYFYAFL